MGKSSSNLHFPDPQLTGSRLSSCEKKNTNTLSWASGKEINSNLAYCIRRNSFRSYAVDLPRIISYDKCSKDKHLQLQTPDKLKTSRLTDNDTKRRPIWRSIFTKLKYSVRMLCEFNTGLRYFAWAVGERDERTCCFIYLFFFLPVLR